MLVTGTPLGNSVTQEDLFVEGAPMIFYQDANANPLNNPDAEGFYWGLSGTSTYPYKALGCVTNVSLTEGVTMNDVRCDTVGTKDTVQRRDYIELNVEVSSLFPISVAADFMNLSTPVVGTGEESVGIGQINNTKKYMVYMPKVYDESSADWLMIHLHKAKFVDAWNIGMTLGEPWRVTGVKIRAYADETKPSNQLFGVIKRFDASALP